MKTALPWIIAVLGIAAAAYFFNANKSTSTQLATLQAQVQELQTLRMENETLKTNQVPADEIGRARRRGRLRAAGSLARRQRRRMVRA